MSPKLKTKGLLATAAVLVLTLLTQIGGVILILSFALARLRKGGVGAFGFLALFVGLYTIGSGLSYAVAPLFGRVPLPCLDDGSSRLRMQSPLYCALNRQYVSPKLQEAATALSQRMDQAFPGTTTLALDANFPFFDGFPLFPHLSHSDGRKLDVAFFYQDADGRFLDQATRSPIGYFAFEEPLPGSPLPCGNRQDLLTLRWDLAFLQPLWRPVPLEQGRTREALRWLSDEGRGFGVAKIFVEPHLAQRLGVEADSIRFQGCRAARHDDHIHMQVGK
ncbi:hypothetical protein [Ensifer sp. MJa1]|uniref:hypothetical protein n=1 Tax=Ensifer sp. MJa1 TaxID=2919888 RepID=UPI003008F671